MWIKLENYKEQVFDLIFIKIILILNLYFVFVYCYDYIDLTQYLDIGIILTYLHILTHSLK